MNGEARFRMPAAGQWVANVYVKQDVLQKAILRNWWASALRYGTQAPSAFMSSHEKTKQTKKFLTKKEDSYS
jgi:hypothetical protein